MRVAYDVSPLSLPRTGVGNYVLSSTQRGLAVAGEWIKFVVVPEDKPPELHLPQQDFAIVAPVSGGVGQNG